jgi:AraC-like DNA-binding protein
MPVMMHVPSPPLDTFIKCFWYSRNSAGYPRLKVLPMPTLHLMVNLGDPYPLYKTETAQPFVTCLDSWFVGLWSGYHIMDVPRDLQVFNVTFKPGGAYPFLQLPLDELNNQIVPLETLWGSLITEIRERLYAAPTLQARFALVEQLFLEHLCEMPYGFNVVQYAVAEIARSHGSLSIRALSDHIGISQKHLIAQFKRMVGGTPKELARLIRFRYVLESVNQTQPVDWTQIAHQANYFDQSHFNKDFEAFTGHSPTD